eukprot:2504221-Rhodomonas_salina.2
MTSTDLLYDATAARRDDGDANAPPRTPHPCPRGQPPVRGMPDRQFVECLAASSWNAEPPVREMLSPQFVDCSTQFEICD